MGVDYSANFGIGFRIEVLEGENIPNSFEGDFVWFLDDLLNGIDYSYFETGDGFYSGERNKYYVILPHNTSLTDPKLPEKLQELKEFLLKNKLIQEIDEADVVGGLLVY